MYQMIVSDLDGTLLNSQSKVSNENIEFIKKIKERKIYFTVATGRSKISVEKLLKENNIYDFVDFLITYNGVSFFDMKKNTNINAEFLSKKLIKDIYERYMNQDVSFVVHNNNTIYCSKENEGTIVESNLNKYERVVVENFIEILSKDYPKLMIIGKSSIIDSIEKEFKVENSDSFNFFRSNTEFFEIVSKNVSKGEMLKKLCEINEVSLEKVAAIGDNLNDLEMIQISGLGVTLENGHNELKKYAKLQTKSNDENGFAELCIHILNQK